MGEVSRVNDDYVDNRFYEKVGRFAEIEEDVEPQYLLYDDYKKYCPFARMRPIHSPRRTRRKKGRERQLPLIIANGVTR